MGGGWGMCAYVWGRVCVCVCVWGGHACGWSVMLVCLPFSQATSNLASAITHHLDPGIELYLLVIGSLSLQSVQPALELLQLEILEGGRRERTCRLIQVCHSSITLVCTCTM